MCLITGRVLTLVFGGILLLLSLVTVEARIIFNKQSKLFKVHIFLEGHKILQNIHCRFDWHYISQNFVSFSEYSEKATKIEEIFKLF